MKLIATILLAFFCIVSPVQAASAVVPTVAVQGSSQVEAIPDQAQINLGVVTTGKTAEEAQLENSVLANAVQAKLFAMGLAESKLQTTQYAVYPIHNEAKDQKAPQIIGYRVSHTLTVTADDLSKIGALIDNALAAGANQILGISFKKRDDTQLKTQALQEAVKEATAKAEAIVAASGKKLGRIVSMQENGVSIHLPEFTQRYMLKADGASTPIMPGSIRVNGTVSIVFEIN
ncbi:hypothetical protein AXX12_02325 [Anaerosporomusa subterranea]|uniref:SIMPL domain-containing protein n=1 Tax=Anaerosporomusa subterranea TaxID=1794912 RepID=A0A154BT45_ANASB|nr:SIMPL domain-containing protein [Anaerosporomusa subterranea]KYZ77000.1 hypothetical protein AXX12_02325 [Anaerosporomusa subterranea]